MAVVQASDRLRRLASALPETAVRLASAPPLRIPSVMRPPIQHPPVPHLPVLFVVLVALLGWAPAARAESVDLELVLAIDSSASVAYNEFNLQIGRASCRERVCQYV